MTPPALGAPASISAKVPPPHSSMTLWASRQACQSSMQVVVSEAIDGTCLKRPPCMLYQQSCLLPVGRLLLLAIASAMFSAKAGMRSERVKPTVLEDILHILCRIGKSAT